VESWQPCWALLFGVVGVALMRAGVAYARRLRRGSATLLAKRAERLRHLPDPGRSPFFAGETSTLIPQRADDPVSPGYHAVSPDAVPIALRLAAAAVTGQTMPRLHRSPQQPACGRTTRRLSAVTAPPRAAGPARGPSQHASSRPYAGRVTPGRRSHVTGQAVPALPSAQLNDLPARKPEPDHRPAVRRRRAAPGLKCSTKQRGPSAWSRTGISATSSRYPSRLLYADRGFREDIRILGPQYFNVNSHAVGWMWMSRLCVDKRRD
jgi:hypothetical protein